MTSRRRSPRRRSISLRRGGRSRRSALRCCSLATMALSRWGQVSDYTIGSARGSRVDPAGWLDSEPMATQRKNRRKKPDRRSGDDRRTKDVPVEAERRTGERSEEHTSELQSPYDLVCRLLLEKKKKSQ